MEPPNHHGGITRRQILLLLGLVLLAAALRFTGLGWGLRHVPDMDERYFVENVRTMLAERDLDHRYYEYPGLFFYLLTPAVALAGDNPTRAVLFARGLVAAVAAINVLVLYFFGRKAAGNSAALIAAALLAVSPVDVHTAHMVRADIVLATLVLAVFAVIWRLNGSPRTDAVAGVAIGAAVALKFTGVLLAPSYLIARFLAGGRRLRGVAIAAVAAGFTFCLLSPYAVIHAREFLEGAGTQVTYHYQQPSPESSPFFSRLFSYAAVWPKALGWVGSALAVAGLASVADRWRKWLPLVCLPLVTLLVFATQTYHFDRHLVPSFSVLALLAGSGLVWLTRGQFTPMLLLAVGTAAFPLARSVAYVREIARPGTRDQVVDWIESNLPDGSRIVSAVPGLGIDRRRFEVLETRAPRPISPLQVASADAAITRCDTEAIALVGAPTAFEARPSSPFAGGNLCVHLIPADKHIRYVPVPLDRARLTSSQGDRLLETVRDGKPDTFFELAPESSRHISIELAEPVMLGRIEVSLASGSNRHVRLSVSVDGSHWDQPAVVPGRPGRARQTAAWSRVFLIEPVALRFVRIYSDQPQARPLRIAEIRLDASVAPGAR